MKAMMYNYTAWINEVNPEVLNSTYIEKLTNAGFEILNKVEKHFEPHGYTCLYLLAESHFAVHTFPEQNTTYIELSSCVEKPFNVFIAGVGNQ